MARKPATPKRTPQAPQPKVGDSKLKGHALPSKAEGPKAKARVSRSRAKALPSIAEVEDLRARLEIAEETLRAIQQGEVDALVVSGPEGRRTFTLQGADYAYQALVETMNEGAVTVDPAGMILYANSRLADLLGRRLETILGARLPAFVVPEDARALEALIEAARQDQSSRGEIRLLWPDSAQVTVLLSASPLQLEGVRGASLVVTDLTLQKRTEAALREAHAGLEAKVKERTKELSQTVQALTAEIGLRKRAEGTIRQQTELLQMQNEELSAQREELQTQNAELRAQQEELEEAEVALRQSETRLRTVLDSSPDPIFLKDREGRMLLANPATFDVVGKPAKAVIGKTDAEFYDDLATGRAIMANDQRIMASGQMEVVEESVTTAAETRFYLSTKAPFRDARGKVIGLIGVSRDITERKRLEERLREIEVRRQVAEAVELERRRLFAVLETIPAMVCLLTPDYHVAFANRTFRERFGESNGRHCYDFCFGNAEPCEFCESYTVLKTGQPHHWELAGPDGSVIEAHDFPFTDVDGSQLILEMELDITQRRRAEETVGRLAAIVESTGEAVIGKTLDGLILNWNRGAEKLYGYEAAEMVGQSVFRLVPPGRHDELAQILEQVKLGRHVEHLETERLRKDGALITVLLTVSPIFNAGGAIVGASSIAHDVTELKRARDAVRQASQYHRSLLEASPDPLVTITPDGKIGDVNTATELATGCSRAELIGADFSEFFTEPDKARAGYQRVFTEGLVRDYALELRHRDGHTTSVLYNASVYKDESGQVAGVFADARDITERKRAEDVIHRLNRDLQKALAEEKSMHERLVQAEKLSALGRMVGSVAHELNNPLQTITNCFFLANQDLAPDSPIHAYLEMAQAETDRLVNLVAQLRELYRMRPAGAPESCRVDQLLQEVRSLLTPQLEHAHVQWQQPADLPEYAVPVIQDRLKQVLINLVTNAIEAMQPGGGGKLRIDVKPSADGRQVGVSIRDTGPGISPEHLSRVFEPFFTTKDQGLGLGLSICYEIVQQHGGQITAESHRGQGAVFTVWLPLVTVN